MSWPISTPSQIAARQIQDLRSALGLPDDAEVNEVTRALAGAWSGSAYELLLFQRVLADELMPDRATEWLPRHASIWDVPRRQPTKARGAALAEGAANLPLPAGIAVTSSKGQLYTTTASIALDAAGQGTVDLVAAEAGSAGNLPSGAVLTLVSPIAGLTGQALTVGSDGLTGGLDIEDIEDWRGRILDEIRNPAAGGTVTDYERWARQVVGASGLVAVYPEWGGLGTVGVIVALPGGGGVPSPAQIAEIEAVMAANRPVTAAVIVLPALLLPVNHTIALTPDTTTTRAAVTTALQAFYGLSRIGEAIPLSRIGEAISAAPGEDSHVLISPTAAITPTRRQLPVLGSITWVSP